ncbi:MAG: anaerobic sulfatase maturase [Lachnospiraceae bacterium]|nr:anaerobic sulfatase maturase [Lachnospiraceae bacterium]
MNNISVLIKPASGMCNMTCDYCFYCDEAEKRKQKSYGFMTEETLKNVIRRTMLRAEGVVSYTWQGGEPSLRGVDFFQKAVALQEKYNRKQIRVINAFQTNGLGITEDWCRFFRENHFLLGVSVDGTEEIHDSMRHGKDQSGTYTKVTETIGLLEKYGIDYNVLTVVTPQIADQVKQVYQHYKDNGWGYQQYIACLDPYGEAHGKTKCSLLPEQYGTFLSELFGLWFRDLQYGRQPYIRQFENYVGLAAGYRAEACEQCGSCGIQYVVEADGSVYPCDFYVMDEYYLGNLNTELLPQMDEKRKELGFLERSLKLDEECRNCPYFRLCRGGCMRNREKAEEESTYRNYFCTGYKIFFAQWYDEIMQLGKLVRR